MMECPPSTSTTPDTTVEDEFAVFDDFTFDDRHDSVCLTHKHDISDDGDGGDDDDSKSISDQHEPREATTPGNGAITPHSIPSSIEQAFLHSENTHYIYDEATFGFLESHPDIESDHWYRNDDGVEDGDLQHALDDAFDPIFLESDVIPLKKGSATGGDGGGGDSLLVAIHVQSAGDDSESHGHDSNGSGDDTTTHHPQPPPPRALLAVPSDIQQLLDERFGAAQHPPSHSPHNTHISSHTQQTFSTTHLTQRFAEDDMFTSIALESNYDVRKVVEAGHHAMLRAQQRAALPSHHAQHSLPGAPHPGSRPRPLYIPFSSSDEYIQRLEARMEQLKTDGWKDLSKAGPVMYFPPSTSSRSAHPVSSPHPSPSPPTHPSSAEEAMLTTIQQFSEDLPILQLDDLCSDD